MAEHFWFAGYDNVRLWFNFTSKKYDRFFTEAILLFGFGNPDSTDQIAEFLFRSQLRRDTVSARLRTKWSKAKNVPIQFVVGQFVLLKNTSDEAVKIGAKKWLGPYKIDKILGTKLVELEGGKKVHASHLKSFVEG